MMKTISLIITIICGCILFGCGEKQTETELLEQAETFEKDTKYDEALHALEKLIREYPESKSADKALHRSAFLYYNNINDFHKSIEFHRKLIENYPTSNYVPQARFMIGFIYANNLKDYANAKIAYNEFLEHHPQHELVESVKWEMEHLGEDINKQLKDIFGEGDSDGRTMVN